MVNAYGYPIEYEMGTLYAAGPIVHEPHSVVFRVIILSRPVTEGTQWIVFNEQWLTPEYDDQGNLLVRMDTSHLAEGFYTDDFLKAVDKFCERVKHPGLESVLRE